VAPAKTLSSAKSQIEILRSEVLGDNCFVHGFSTRKHGYSSAYGGRALNLGFTVGDLRATVERNRGAFFRKLKIEPRRWKLLTLRQIHSDIVHHLDSPPTDTLAGDGLVTSTPGQLLAIQTADCLPVLLSDPKRRAVGAFHAGWRGTLARIIEKGVGEMRKHFGSRPQDLKAAIGPGIHSCCYEVGPELQDKFQSQFGYAVELFREVRESNPVHEKYPLLFLTARAPGHGPDEPKIYLDLVAANRRQLLDSGVLAKNISVSPLCTSCRTDLLFSYRAEKGKTGRLMSVIGVRP
jgi:YfiH family protein